MTIYIITGPCGAGKSTTADLLVEKFEKSVRIENDDIRHMVKRGFLNPANLTAKSHAQLELAAHNICMLAKSYEQAGYTVIIDEVLDDKRILDIYKSLAAQIILLLPSKEAVRQRDQSRQHSVGQRALDLHDNFTNTHADWITIDNTKIPPEEVVELIMNSRR